MSDKPLVYDVGMHVGANVDYYLAKGYRVIGIEADPELAQQVEARFRDAIGSGNLRVLNLAVGAETGTLPFFVNRETSVKSSLVAPKALGDKWTKIDVSVRRLSDLISEYGRPEFVKIDVEHYDRHVLVDLAQHRIIPPAVSVEAHSVEILCHLIAMEYTRFQLVNCREIGRSVSRMPINKLDGTQTEFQFVRHSAGPFGDDLPDAWVGTETILSQWLGRDHLLGRGWFDVHAALAR